MGCFLPLPLGSRCKDYGSGGEGFFFFFFLREKERERVRDRGARFNETTSFFLAVLKPCTCNTPESKMYFWGETGKEKEGMGLLLRVENAVAGYGGDEDDGSAALVLDHVPAAGLGEEEGAGEVDVEESAEHVGVVGFGFDVGAGEGRVTQLVKKESFLCVIYAGRKAKSSGNLPRRKKWYALDDPGGVDEDVDGA